MQTATWIRFAGVWLGANAILLGQQTLASREDVKKALDYSKDHQEENIEKQIAIAQVPASPFVEEQRGRYIADEFRRLGLENVEIDPKGNVLGWRKGRSPRAMVVAAHIDTVFPPGTDFTVKRQGPRLNGPGVADDSRGLAAMIGLVEALNAGDVRTNRTLLFVGDVGEEGIGNLRGIKYLFEEGAYKDRLDAFISIDGDRPARVVSAEIGSRRYRVTLSGPGGHSWGNFGRVNPAEALGRIIARLAEIEAPKSPRTSYNVGRIGGGTSVNSIPFEAWFEFDMRSVEEDELIQLERQFLKAVDSGVEAENRSRDTSGGILKVDAKRVGLRHAIPKPPNETLTRAAMQAIHELGLGEPVLESGSTDANAVSSLNKPAITLGGGGLGGNFHSLEEWYEPKDAYQGIQNVLLTVLGYDAMAPPAVQ
jgi:tripeptide aminopeptidase